MELDESRALMRELDRDGDGRMNYREFVQFLKSSSSAGLSRPTTPTARKRTPLTVSDRVATELRTKFDAAIDSGKIRSYEDVFRAMDKDGDGTVSKAEFEDGLRDLRVCCWSGVMAWTSLVDVAVLSGCISRVQVRLEVDESRTLMRELDRDGDGRMNYREFVQFLKSSRAAGLSRPTTPTAPKRTALTVSDRVATELRTKFDAAIDSGKIRSYEDVFRAMDKDQSGTVSKAEFEDGLRQLRV